MSFKALESPAGRLLVGAPRKPVSDRMLTKLSRMLSDLELVKEAHLPDILELGSGRPTERTLVVVVGSESAIIPVTGIVEVRIEQAVPRSLPIALRVVTEDFPLLSAIRSIQCVVGWRD